MSCMVHDEWPTLGESAIKNDKQRHGDATLRIYYFLVIMLCVAICGH